MKLLKTLAPNEFKDEDTNTTYLFASPTALTNAPAEQLIDRWLKSRAEILLKQHVYGKHHTII